MLFASCWLLHLSSQPIGCKQRHEDMNPEVLKIQLAARVAAVSEVQMNNEHTDFLLSYSDHASQNLDVSILS